MSVRAYRVNEIKMEKGSTFNLWHDSALFDFLTAEGYIDSLDSDCCGMIEINIDILKKAVKTVKLEKETKKQLKRDIKWTKERKKKYITYNCF